MGTPHVVPQAEIPLDVHTAWTESVNSAGYADMESDLGVWAVHAGAQGAASGAASPPILAVDTRTWGELLPSGKDPDRSKVAEHLWDWALYFEKAKLAIGRSIRRMHQRGLGEIALEGNDKLSNDAKHILVLYAQLLEANGKLDRLLRQLGSLTPSSPDESSRDEDYHEAVDSIKFHIKVMEDMRTELLERLGSFPF